MVTMQPDEWQKELSELQDTDIDGYSSTQQIDPKKYRQYLDETGWSEEAQDEWLNTLWKLMSTFVDVAWGVDPAQTAMPPLAKLYTESRSEMSEAKNKPSLIRENRSRTRAVKTSSPPPRKTRTSGR
jgi:hypothetical protein